MRRPIIACALVSLVAAVAHAAPAVSDAELVQYAVRAASRNTFYENSRMEAQRLRHEDRATTERYLRHKRLASEATVFCARMSTQDARERLVPLLARLTPGWGGYESVSYVLALKGIETGANVHRMFGFFAPGAGERAPLTAWEQTIRKLSSDEWDVDVLPYRLVDVYRQTHDPAVMQEALSPPVLDGSYAMIWPQVVMELMLRDPKGMLSVASGSHALTKRLGSFLFISDMAKDEREKAAAILRDYARGPNAGLAAVARACLEKKPTLEAPGGMFGP
jgi:hypothetical protein